MVEVDVRPEPVELCQGDALVLCSDGFWSMVNEDEMAKLFSAGDLQAAVKAGIDLALERGADDNTTVGVLRVENGAATVPEVIDAREALCEVGTARSKNMCKASRACGKSSPF